MLKRNYVAIVVALGAMLFVADGANAQMFGSRRTGRPLSRRPSPGLDQSMEDIGSVQGNERFLRNNRRPTDFVGPDLGELLRFIGNMQATARGQTNSAIEGIRRRVDRSATVNQPAPPATARGTMYPPRLDVSVSMEAPPPASDSVAADALGALVDSPRLSGSSRIAVSVEGRTAILRGEVPSAADRDLAVVLLSFEPGISSVHNELVVNRQLRTSPDSLQALRDRQRPRGIWTTTSHGSTEAVGKQLWTPPTSRSY